MDAQTFKSPLRKLLSFFRGSRDAWKRKCQEAKRQLKLLGNQVRAVEKSREQWREKAQTGEQRIRELERELEALKRLPC